MATKTIPELLGFGGTVFPVWEAGFQRRGAMLMSPLDGEIYQKIAADGNDSTDPANDVTNYIARSFQRATSLPNIPGATNANGLLFRGDAVTGMTKVSGPSQNNVESLLVNLTGRGMLTALVLGGPNDGQGTYWNMRLRLLVDGRSIFDQNTSLGGLYGRLLLGSLPAKPDGNNIPGSISEDSHGVHFRRSLQIYVTSPYVSGSSLSYLFRALA